VRRAARPDVAALVAGVVLIAFGAVLLLDQLDALELRFGTLAPIAFAAVGAILLASGLSRRS
jgi:cell wall-active antibiotic response 4TMS protein YvqF